MKFTGILSVDALSVGGISAMATFGEMTTRALTGCDTVDGIMGMGLSSSSDTQSIFEDFVNVSSWTETTIYGALESTLLRLCLSHLDMECIT